MAKLSETTMIVKAIFLLWVELDFSGRLFEHFFDRLMLFVVRIILFLFLFFLLVFLTVHELLLL